MSGPEDTRETAEAAGATPAAAAPPSFGGAKTPDGTTPTGLPTLPPFGLETPWWASDDPSSDAPAGGGPEAAEPAPPAEAAPAAEQIPEPDAEQPSEPPPEQTSEQPVPTSEQSTGTEQAAFERAREAEKASAPLAPVLVPDAIHPPGFVPPTGSGPHPQVTPAQPDAPAQEAAPDAAGTVITPAYHSEGGLPIDVPPQADGTGRPPTPPAAPSAPKAPGNRRRPLLIGGGAAVVLAAVGALFALNGSGGSKDDDATRQAAGRPAGQATSAAPSSPPASAPAKPATPPGKPSKIDDEKTDKRDLAFTDVFPTENIRLDGHAYSRDRWSINRAYRYAANGAMLEALKREKCRKIVRATYLDKERSIAVTSGIAVLPTKAAALAVSQAGDPAKYEWFRGMAGKHSAAVDRAGGYAASTVRGRYVIYSYVQYANGKQAQPGDPVIKKVAQQFLDYTAKPINTR